MCSVMIQSHTAMATVLQERGNGCGLELYKEDTGSGWRWQWRGRKAMSYFSQECLGWHKALHTTTKNTPHPKRETLEGAESGESWMNWKDQKKLYDIVSLLKFSFSSLLFSPVALDWLLTDSMIKLLVFWFHSRKCSYFSASHFPPLSLHIFTSLGLFCILPFFIIPFSIILMEKY